MPFGHKCEYPTFDACVAAQRRGNKSLESAQKICGALKRDTEQKCASKSVDAKLELLKSLGFKIEI